MKMAIGKLRLPLVEIKVDITTRNIRLVFTLYHMTI